MIYTVSRQYDEKHGKQAWVEIVEGDKSAVGPCLVHYEFMGDCSTYDNLPKAIDIAIYLRRVWQKKLGKKPAITYRFNGFPVEDLQTLAASLSTKDNHQNA
jgi:hypothetical protein